MLPVEVQKALEVNEETLRGLGPEVANRCALRTDLRLQVGKQTWRKRSVGSRADHGKRTGAEAGGVAPTGRYLEHEVEVERLTELMAVLALDTKSLQIVGGWWAGGRTGRVGRRTQSSSYLY